MDGGGSREEDRHADSKMEEGAANEAGSMYGKLRWTCEELDEKGGEGTYRVAPRLCRQRRGWLRVLETTTSQGRSALVKAGSSYLAELNGKKRDTRAEDKSGIEFDGGGEIGRASCRERV